MATVVWGEGKLTLSALLSGGRVLRAPQTTVLLTEDSPVAASSNTMLCKKTFEVQLSGVSDIKYFLYRLSKIYA